MRRQTFPTDVVNLRVFYIRKKIVRVSFLVGLFIFPWLMIGLYNGFNRGSCSSKVARDYRYLEGFCAGTYLSQVDEVRWYLDIWHYLGRETLGIRAFRPGYAPSYRKTHE